MTAEEIVSCKKAHVWQNYTPISLRIAYVENDSEHNMAFGADFENDIGNSGSMWTNYHCTLIRRSSSKDRYPEPVSEALEVDLEPELDGVDFPRLIDYLSPVFFALQRATSSFRFRCTDMDRTRTTG